MADIRCSNCGKDNPDFLDVCQFCQSPLQPESTLYIGEEPTKKDTGELEEILPDWLKDARQQGKNVEASDDAFTSQIRSKVLKDEPPDLLAGLMSQSDSDEDEVPDWLAGITAADDKKPSLTKSSSKDEAEPPDFFAQFQQPESKPADSAVNKAEQEDVPAWMGMEEKPSEPDDGLSNWFSQTTAEPSGTTPDDNSWMRNLGSFDAPSEEPPVQKEPEDLSWLRDLETASKGMDESPAPKQATGFDFTPSSSEDDLSWLNNLGGASASALEKPASSQPAASGEDLSWLDELGGATAPAFEEPAPSHPATSGEDLSWLKDLGDTPASKYEEPSVSQPVSSGEDLSWLKDLGGVPASEVEEPAPSQPATSGEDLSWLNELGSAPAPAFEEPVPSQPATSGEDLGWLNELGSAPAPAFEEPAPSQPTTSNADLDWLNNLGETPETHATAAQAFADTGELYGREFPESSKPFQTAPLNELLGDESIKDVTPDWLKNALEEPSMPAPGAVSMDWFSAHEKQAETRPEGPSAPTQGEPASPQPAFDFSFGESSASASQDVDSLFGMEMPDWLSSEQESAPPSQPETEVEPTSTDETLAPVELPSWVQAMRPVDSAISDATASNMDQVTETQGPLAGFRGVIPMAPIGSALRPKAFSMKLQVTEEQQTGASLLEQIIANETLVQPRKAETGVSSQRVLRWSLTGLFLIVLGAVLGLGMRTMPISASAAVNELSNLVTTIPDGSPVLVVIDYEPSFTGELEVAAGPLLDQLAQSRHSAFTFVSMSPNGSALVDRLMFNTKVGKPVEAGGLGYQLGTQYFNLGFLPGGSSGVLGFIENADNAFTRFEAIVLMTDNAETGRVWVEQLEAAEPEIADKPLFLISSAQSGPMLQPYATSGQVDIMVSGLYDAAKYEFVNNTRPGTARVYWDAFGAGLMMAVIAIVLGSVWSVFMRIREQRAEAEQG